ncbi:hypothetical protein [Paenibacillus sedimenti]|uniref:Uncharacterized protein n=1 Tax=Paenibacillus sedimenti TaxID=2770274 RepID=A0A926QHT3_9BACL|nr:hypothetical protein [Paenibacillus sedimenti]MBD0379886.1 hypothetical protein [Paenibacillus sedimenti]
MGGFIVSLFLVVVGYVILYLIIKAAINNSEMSSFMQNEIRTIRNQNTKSNEELNKQFEEIKLLLNEQNQLLREQNTNASKEN